MSTVALTYAKTHFSELAERAAQGEEIVVTRHQMPLVKLVPANRPSLDDIREIFSEMDAVREGSRLGDDLSIEELRKEGRR